MYCKSNKERRAFVNEKKKLFKWACASTEAMMALEQSMGAGARVEKT